MKGPEITIYKKRMTSTEAIEANYHHLLPPLQEDEDTAESVDTLMASLPSLNGWFRLKSVFYEGFWYTDRCFKGLIHSQKRLKALDTDVFLVTPPKSGTTWMKALIFSILNRKLYPNTLTDHPLLKNSPHSLVFTMEVDFYTGRPEADPSSFASPRIIHSHSPFSALPDSVKDSKARIVYICRNPKDMFTSFWHFSMKRKPEEVETPSLEEAFDWFCKGITPFGPLWESMICYWKESLERPEKVLFFKYEDLKENPFFQVKKLAEFLNVPFSPAEEREVVGDIVKLCSFDSLSKMEVNQTGVLSSGYERNVFFRKGQIGDSINLLTPEMAEKIDQIFEEKLTGYGLKF